MRKLNTKDVFNFVRLVNNSGLKEEIKSVAVNIPKEKDEKFSIEGVGFDIVFSILEKFASKNLESHLYEFLSGPFETTAENVGEMDFFKLVENFFEVSDIESWKAFLKRAIRLT